MVIVFTTKKVIKSETKGNHRNKVLDFEKLTENIFIFLHITDVYINILYPHPGRAECRFKDLLLFFGLMKVSLEQEPNKERVTQRVAEETR